jgi:methylated-DNA-[protein]-cysteine S-methyltransferase
VGARRDESGALPRPDARGLVVRTLDCPIGPLLVVAGPRGIIRAAFGEEDPARVVEEASQASVASPSPGAVPPLRASVRTVDAFARELDAYFDRRLRTFATPVDLALVDGFARRVLESTARIPYGIVATYGELAKRAGSPRGGRAAGNALHRNLVPILIPCHRVVPAGGGLGGYGGCEDRKAMLLTLEESL